MTLSKKNVVGIAVDISLPKKVEVKPEELLQKRISAIRLQSVEKKLSEGIGFQLMDILKDAPLFYLRSKSATIDFSRDSISLRIPSGPPSFNKEPEKEILPQNQASRIASDFNILLGVFLNTLGTPIEKVKKKSTVLFAQKSGDPQLAKALDKQLFALAQKTTGIDSVTGMTFVRKAAGEKERFECSLRHRAEQNIVEVIAQFEDESTTFTIDLEAIVARATDEANRVFALFVVR